MISIQTVLLIDPVSETQDLQLICMENLIVFDGSTSLHERLQEMDFTTEGMLSVYQCCHWKGVECIDNTIDEIRWNDLRKGTLRLDWIPPSVTLINFYSVAAHNGTLNTRRLPRNMVECLIVRSELTGPLDIKGLPKKMEVLSLRSNRFSGTIYLVALPNSLKTLCLKWNKIEKVVVLNSAIPEGFAQGSFYQYKNPKLKCLDGQTVDSRINFKLDLPDWDSDDLSMIES